MCQFDGPSMSLRIVRLSAEVSGDKGDNPEEFLEEDLRTVEGNLLFILSCGVFSNV